MLFLGSEKYPGENEYKAFLAQHGGRSNASTSMHLTTFKFDVLAQHAEQALDIFSNFFVAPLFTQSGTSREIHAVDSENSKNLTADVRRRLQILKSLANPAHYYSKFTTGNAQTLRTESPQELEQLRQALLAFHAQHYSPDQLTVVVAGPQSLDTLQEWVVTRFAPMQARPFPPANDKNNTDKQTAAAAAAAAAEELVQQGAAEAPAFSYDQCLADPTCTDFDSPFVPDIPLQWPFLVTTKPVRSVRKLVLMFPLPSVHMVPDQSPVSVLSHLLGHEGPNSSFAVLQNAGLINSLSAGPRATGPDFTLFQVEIGLTEMGEARWKHVVDVVLQHCQLIAHDATTAAKDRAGEEDLIRIWGESATLRAMFFHETSPGSVYDLAPRLSQSIVRHGTEKSICAGSMLQEGPETFPLEQVADFASRLVLSNCVIERCSQQAWDVMEASKEAERKTESWYSVDYYLSRFSDADIAAWNDETGKTSFFNARDELELPRPNRYIPRTLELCPDLPEEAKAGPRIEKPIDPPNLLVDIPTTGRLWHRLDDRYALPKSVLTILIRNAAVFNVKDQNGVWQQNTAATVHSSLLAGIFAEAMAQETYDASLAGLHWGLSLNASGIFISCTGFSDRLPDLALFVLQEFLSGEFCSESYFHSTKDRIVRGLKTFFESRRADAHANYYRDFLLASKDSSVEESLAATMQTTPESTKEHHKKILANTEVSVECLFTGNVSEKEARDFFFKATDGLSVASGVGKLDTDQPMWIPETLERRLLPQTDVELHFASKNSQEENGAVLVTYQSPIPGYRGDMLSSSGSLKSSSAIRLLCHMLRELLFDELRTKQTLGYIVSSYYDVGFSSPPDSLDRGDPFTVPVDYIVVAVLSRKVTPPEVAKRIDEFLVSFRKSLVEMPESEIRHHAHALSTKLLKPIQKLSTEASGHFAKIRRFTPELMGQTNGQRRYNGRNDIPWDNAPQVAQAVESMNREDLLQVWDGMMLAESRARIVSCVYGTTFPLEHKRVDTSLENKGQPVVIHNKINQIVELRSKLPVFDANATPATPRPPRFGGLVTTPFLRFSNCMRNHRSVFLAGLAATAFAAAGWTWLSSTRSKKLATR